MKKSLSMLAVVFTGIFSLGAYATEPMPEQINLDEEFVEQSVERKVEHTLIEVQENIEIENDLAVMDETENQLEEAAQQFAQE